MPSKKIKQYILSYQQNPESGTNIEIGGKAKNLFRLKKLGFNVPKWSVLSQEFMLSILPVHLLTNINNKKIIQFIEQYTLSPEIIAELLKIFDTETKYFAVRSSAADEDGSNFSFAGQFDTFLYVTRQNIALKIKEVWKSSFSEHLIKYRIKNNIEQKVGISVIVQEMINAQAAGVAFGINPVTGNKQEKVISAVFGLGEGLVSGELNADTYTVSKDKINKDIACKTHQIIQSETGENIAKVSLESTTQNNTVLTDNQILKLEKILINLEEKLLKPQDIEFAIFNQQIYLLQTRPITAVGSEKGEYTLWDNSNIIESYPGITTPLTYSFIIKMYEAVYRQFVGLLGLKEPEIEKYSTVFANTLGFVRGRVYYNLLNWYKMLAMVPGYSINAKFMENMMGVKERFELTEDFIMKKSVAKWRVFSMVFKMIKLQIKLPNERQKFMKHLEKVITEYKKINFSELSLNDLRLKYLTFEQTLLKKWKAPLINDFFAMIWFGLLQKLTTKYKISENQNIHNDLLCGSQDIISVQPIHRTMEIASFIKKDKKTSEFFTQNSPEVIYKTLKNGEYKEIYNLISLYIQDFGERCVGELKLETISYSQKPEIFINLLKTYLKQNISVKKSAKNADNSIRIKAEKEINKSLKGKFIKKKFFNWVLKKAREHVSNRENLRFERTRGFGMVRKIFTEIDIQFHTNGITDELRDAFMLTKEEIFEIIQKTNSFNTKELISLRKTTFSEYKNQEIPSERFYTYGNDFSDAYIFSQEKIEAFGNKLQGTGCCPGRVKAKARVVLNPNEIESLNSDILITSSTDPGWVTLFPTASAIIVERGSLLSHSAIVSREMGIPCIVGVNGLLRTVKTGDILLIDGSSGEISIIKD